MASEEQEQVEVEVMEGMNEEEDAGGSNMVIIIVVVILCILCVTLAGVAGCWWMGMLCFAVDEFKCEVEGDHCKDKYFDKDGDGAKEKTKIDCPALIKDEKEKDKAKEKCTAPVGFENKDPCCTFSDGKEKK